MTDAALPLGGNAIDYTALTTSTDRAAVARYRAAARASGAPWATSSLKTVLGVLAMAAVAGVFVTMGGTMIAFILRGSGTTSPIGLAFVGFVLLVIGLALWATARGLLALRGTWARWWRLDAFARANGMRFSPLDADPAYPGAIFGLGDDRAAVDHLRTASGRSVDLGSYRWSTGSGRSRSTHTWGFVAIALDRALPHMVLDSRANNGLFGGTNLPSSFARDQVLHLEGDFDEHFTLYAPRAYERDALYVFTPDLMALLIDEAAPFDVEIVDRWMFVYSTTAFALDEATLRRLFGIVDTVGAKALSQTERYADERIGDRRVDAVAPGGRRLRTRISVGAIVLVVVAVGGWLWSTLQDALP